VSPTKRQAKNILARLCRQFIADEEEAVPSILSYALFIRLNKLSPLPTKKDHETTGGGRRKQRRACR
jgi:hypothetical protein